MIRDYLTAFARLPMILARINKELEGKASAASVTTLRHTVSKKVDTDDHSVVCSIINERLNRTHERLEALVNEIARLNAASQDRRPATDITPLVQKVRAPRKPKGSQ